MAHHLTGQPPAPILVVDDRPENIIAIQSALRRPDVTILTALSGAEALRQVLKVNFAVILMDVLMPEMDGLEAAELIHSRQASRCVPIIFLTAAGKDRALISRSYALGAADYLVKPLDTAVLRAKVAVFVDLHHTAQASLRQQDVAHSHERALSAAALSHSEALFDATFYEAGVGVGHLDVRGCWLRVNPRLCEILAAPADALVGRPASADLLPLDGRKSEHPASGRAQLVSGEYASCGQHTLPLVLEVKVSAFCGAPTGREAWVCMVQDVTEARRSSRRQAMMVQITEALLTTRDPEVACEALVQQAVPSMGDWCMVERLSRTADQPVKRSLAHRCAAEGQTALAMCRALREDGKSTLGQRLGGSTPRLFAGIEAAFPHVQAADAQTIQLLAAVGSQSLIIVPMHAGDATFGSILFGYGAGPAAFDELDLMAAVEIGHRFSLALDNAHLYAQSQRAVAVRDEFMSIASHELRTPLTPLLMQLGRLDERRNSASRPVSQEGVHRIARASAQQVSRLAGLVDSLLDVSRIASGQLEVRPQRMDLVQAVRDVAMRFAEKFSDADCTLTIDAQEQVLGDWDPLRLEQVIVNLLSNAAKYGGGGPIEVQVGQAEGQAQLTIRDHGIGIEASQLELIFERFERATADRQYQGLGLGLYIVRQILAQHGGSVAVSSQPEQGSTFTVRLPLAQAAAAT